MLSEVPGLLPATAALHLTPQAVKSINRCSVKWPWMNAYSSNNSFLKGGFTVQYKHGNLQSLVLAILSQCCTWSGFAVSSPAAPLFRPRAPLTARRAWRAPQQHRFQREVRQRSVESVALGSSHRQWGCAAWPQAHLRKEQLDTKDGESL